MEDTTSTVPARSGIGARLRAAREARGMTMVALAESAEVARSTLFNFELESHVPSLPVIGRIAKALDVQPGWLAFGEGEGPAVAAGTTASPAETAA